jgi:hypothetical protein
VSLPLVCTLLLAAAPPVEYRVSGPYTHDNLSLFPIHGSSGGKTAYLTLKAAMEQKKVVVHETKNVNELTIENLSDQDVFIQGGDIVKGGEQDRMLSNDFVLAPRSGKVPISAFCVEHGRWSQRGAEPAHLFASSADMAATKNVKIAAQANKSQTDVWNEVAKTQGALAANTRVVGGGGSGVRAPASPSSYQLSLESRPVAEAVARYVKALNGVVAGKADVVGLAFAVNGEVNSADLYSSPELFAAMWPKLLKSSAVEAVRLLQKGKSFPPCSVSAVQALLRDAEAGKESTVDIDRRVKLVSRESDKEMLFESRDGAGWVHRNYIKK